MLANCLHCPHKHPPLSPAHRHVCRNLHQSSSSPVLVSRHHLSLSSSTPVPWSMSPAPSPAPVHVTSPAHVTSPVHLLIHAHRCPQPSLGHDTGDPCVFFRQPIPVPVNIVPI